LAKSKEAASQHNERINQAQRYKDYGIGSVEQIDRQIDHQREMIDKYEAFVKEHRASLDIDEKSYEDLQQEMDSKQMLFDQVQEHRYSLNQFRQEEEWMNALKKEGSIRKSMIALKSKVSKAKFEVTSSKSSIRSVTEKIDKAHKKIEELQSIRDVMSKEEAGPNNVLTPLGLNLESACARAERFIDTL
ncbi:hypothetical protein, partial [Oleiphilus sp. HI0117]